MVKIAHSDRQSQSQSGVAKSTVATLAIGTEVTDGQILDRNSQWLSAQVVDSGCEVVEHRAVPDDRDRILRALENLVGEAALILVTGGLGPTSDDITRDCIAELLGVPLEWHEPSWVKILERLRARDVPVTENQKRQCYFPAGAKVLKNSNGTANAFSALTKNGVRIVSLPGPPGEIEAIWNKGGLKEIILAMAPSRPRELTLLRTMGRGEGLLASAVEEIADRVMLSHVGFARPVIGYRAHAPYVEIKLWFETAQANAVAQIANEIRREFQDILVNEGAQDVADEILTRMAIDATVGIKTVIFDGVTQGQLASRLFTRLSELRGQMAVDALQGICTYIARAPFEVSAAILKPEAKTSVLSVAMGDSELELIVARGEHEKHIELSKLAGSAQTERGRKWAVEIALREWSRL